VSSPDRLNFALNLARLATRNLVMALKDNGYSREEAVRQIEDLKANVPMTDSPSAKQVRDDMCLEFLNEIYGPEEGAFGE
jgi:hypothetical protein